MIRDPRKLAARMTAAQRTALITAVRFDDSPTLKGKWYPRLSVRMDVRHRLQLLGLLSLRPGHGLTKLGEQVREVLLGEFA